ncbi:MAG: hypothetical protein Q9173_004087 [Seirophora scorigena]
MAEIATEIGLPYILSTAASSSIEEVAKANGDGVRWFQLYWPQDNEITKSLLNRAKSNGYGVLIVTLDTWALAWRPADLDNAYIPFASGIGDQTGFSDPVFRSKFADKHDNKTPEDDVFLASREWEADVFSGAAHTWEELELLKQEWDGPIVLKGIQHVEDAKKAVEMGMQGIVVSNHGGRQLDGAIGSLEVLPEIVEAVGDKLTVLFDSGVRTGADVIKALCLGAKGVLIGRPWVYGLGIAGRQGARDVLKGILADLDQSIATIVRTEEQCIRRAIGSLLDGLTHQRRSNIHPSVFFAQTNPHQHPVYHEPWLKSVANDILQNNVDDEELARLRSLEENHQFWNKSMYDSDYLL